MDNKQALKELNDLSEILAGICEMHFTVYKRRDAKTMTDRICERMEALNIAINALRGIDLLSGGGRKKREAAEMANKYGVKVGQIWQDNDPRMQMMKPVRTVEVLIVDDTHAVCQNRDSGKITRIKISRFKANSTGYRLVDDVKNE